MYWPKSLKSLRIVVRKPWRYPPVTGTIVAQAPRLGVLGQVADLAPHRRVRGLARSQGLQLVQHNPALAGFEQSSKSAVKLPAPILGQPQRRQCPAEVMHGVTPVEHLDHPEWVQFDPGDHPIQPRPNPRRA